MASLLTRLRFNIALKAIKQISFFHLHPKPTQVSFLSSHLETNISVFHPVCCFSSSSLYFARKEIPFTYVREKKPQSITLSGDNEGLPTVDTQEPCLQFRESEELKNADDMVKKLFSIHFAAHKELVRRQRWEIMRKVQKHEFDTGSTEAQVAAMTVRIRNLQRHMIFYRKEQKGKVILKELIDARKKMLKKLQRQDYLRFEWLLQELNIIYHPPPIFYHWTTRKGTLRTMTKNHCNNIRKVRIEAYRKKLKTQQEEFYKKKEELMKWIEKEERELQAIKI